MGIRLSSLRKGLTLVHALLLSHALVPPGASAQAPPSGVFTEAQTAIVSPTGPASEPATVRSRVVQVDTRKIAAARRGREILQLNLFDDAVIEVRINRVRPTRAGYFISGTPRGMEWGEARLVVNGPVIVGTVETPESKFTIRSAGSNRALIRQIDSLQEPFSCEVEIGSTLPPSPAGLPSISSAGSPGAGAVSGSAVQADDAPTEDGTEVRVLVVYTPAVEEAHGGSAGIRALIDLMVESTNQVFEESGINPRIVLAHAARVRYVEGAPFAYTGVDLRRLISPDDGYADEVHGLRNRYAADLVHLLGYGGPSGAASAMRYEELRFESRAFSVSFVDDGNLAEYAFAHELGHNFGMLHDRYLDGHNEAIYPYAYGYVNKRAFEDGSPASSRWRTLMAYNNRCRDARFSALGCEWLFRFSNPDQTYRGDPLGVPGEERVDDPDGPSDARRTINNTARWVASFRSQACSEFSVSPERNVVSALGGRIELAVDTAPGCMWSVSSAEDFLTIASDALTASSGSAVIEVEANERGAERSGTVTVAGTAITVVQLATTEGVCGRSSGIFQEITRAAGYDDAARCDEVTEDELAGITSLDVRNKRIGALKKGDFSDLGGLNSLLLDGNDLVELPDGIFAGLAKLESLSLAGNRLNSLPQDAFSGLASLDFLDLTGNELTALPEGIFSGLSRLETLHLDFNRLARLPSGIFADVAGLRNLRLANNRLEELPAGIFSALTGLKFLELDGNRLVRLPAGLSDGLSELTILQVEDNRISDMEAGFFDQLPSLVTLGLKRNRLKDLSPGIFNNLSSLEQLNLIENELTDLPEGSFSGLRQLDYLNVSKNHLRDLPANLFSDLSSLQYLYLENCGLDDLAPGLFAGLVNLNTLSVALNRISVLPPGLFKDLSSLNRLELGQNLLADLPDGFFAELPELETLYLRGNFFDPLPLPVNLTKVGDGQFKAVMPTGAPFTLGLTVSVSSGGEIEGGADTLLFPARAVESEPVEVTRAAGAEKSVSVKLRAFPELPEHHFGYSLQKGDSPTLEIIPAHATKDVALQNFSLSEGTLSPAFSPETANYAVVVSSTTTYITLAATQRNPDAMLEFLDGSDNLLVDADTNLDGHQASLNSGKNEIKLRVTSEDATETRTYSLIATRDGAGGVCARTPQVSDTIVDRLGLDNCSDVTEEHLSTITGLSVDDYKALSLQPGDFAGLENLNVLVLDDNGMTSLPADIFSGLRSLEDLWILDNRLGSLPAGLFSELTALERLLLSRNELEDLPEGIFADLKSLKRLGLSGNRLSSLPANVFSALSSLESLDLGFNKFTRLSTEFFSGLTSIKILTLQHNPITSLPEGIFSGMQSLEWIDLHFLPHNSIPRGLFSGLTSVRYLGLGGGSLSSLPEGVFSGLIGLEVLELHDNRLRSLPPGLFSGLTALRTLWLPENQLKQLPAGIFSGLSSLQRLALEKNLLNSLPTGVFSDLAALEDLYLSENQLRSLEDGVFLGLAPLTELEIQGNILDPLPLGITLRKMGDTQFKAIAPSGAPFDLVLPITVSESGAIGDAVNTLTIPSGVTESKALNVTRPEGSEEAVTVDFGVLPAPPLKHQGYELKKDETLPRVILPGPKLPPPAKVVDLDLTPGVEQLEISWAPVADADGYTVQWKSGEEDYSETRLATVSAGDTVSYTITDLTAGTEYTVRVISTRVNADDGVPSLEVTGTPLAMPASQVQDVAVTPGIEQLEVTWASAPDADGYKVQWKSGEEDFGESRQAALAGGGSTTHTIMNLVPGTDYTVRVIATREHAADGDPSDGVTGIPKASRPALVTGVTAEPGVDELDVSWTAVSGADGYKVQWKSGQVRPARSRCWAARRPATPSSI